MKILVTGGAGYIGSVCVSELVKQGHKVAVVDNLSNSSKDYLNENSKFYELNLIDKDKLRVVFEENSFDVVIHFASYKAVNESMSDASKYSENIVGSINLFDLMHEFSVNKIIFSSSAAVYGDVDADIVDESYPVSAVNYYGFTKLKIEEILEWYHKIYDLDYIALRYFNVAGDVLSYVDKNAKNVFPIIVNSIISNSSFKIFGTDYATPDGTCIRDYVHVSDLVNAHILALESNYVGVLNLGSGHGFSVKELVEVFKRLSGVDFDIELAPRREGDPAKIVASNKLAKEKLSWVPVKSLDDMVESTLRVYSLKP